MSKFISGFFVLVLLVVGFGGSVSAADDKNCPDFNGDADAIAKFWVDNNYSASNDPHGLDRDNDGLPCEADQAAIDKYKDQTQTDTEANTAEEEDNNDTAASANDDSDGSTTTDESSASTESEEAASAQQGEELPKTATNTGVLMLISGGLAAAGLVTLVINKKQRA
ncbi:excalibur calcium-binding domain-containing protein [Terribacillus saccharophilus]|uniref:LPXTG cell wall anchor domain-containing protein n=1 Tax=Terribacillus saccharophilus TaxID=361277 RepID=UPI00398261BC